ncbi:hypothetical protein [Lentzea sp. NPDC060358]|uniref:hypothetical protein n=1 Tax=Lentzea sp. NPDC060358 TaxID=3347103 RepID=UPI00364A4A16
MTMLSTAPAATRPAQPAASQQWQPNCRAVRHAVDLMGLLGVVSGTATGTFTLVFGGALVLLAGTCLHASARTAGPRQP